MANWIDEEAEKFQAERNKQAEREKLVELSGYWLNLRQQIEKDVEQINNHPAFKEVLKNQKITVIGNGKSYQITKRSEPTAKVTVENLGEEILLKVHKIHYFGDTEPTTESEKLQVKMEDRIVVLKGSRESFDVPEQAAQYILQPIVGAIKNTE